MNLGLVVLDTLRHDVYDDVMGDLSSLADHTFERTYSTSRWTVPAHASLFTGLYPSEVGVGARSRHLTTPRRTLAERLSSAGYDTAALSNNVHIDSFFDFDRGFETLHRGPALRDRPEDDRSEFDWEGSFRDSTGVGSDRRGRCGRFCGATRPPCRRSGPASRCSGRRR
ncbi:sulfatase-like hydrolase/transferase [Halorussus caseinilyticus]|uniref:Sulfatase-like hydrolase/transferase n=1 Tax=Halorussus caseinilyticus TaxID=3034025 RepID=A0ABD5WUG0_9EURY